MKTALSFALALVFATVAAYADGNNSNTTQSTAAVKSVKHAKLSSPEFKNTQLRNRTAVEQVVITETKPVAMNSLEYKNTPVNERSVESNSAIITKKSNLMGPKAKNHNVWDR